MSYESRIQADILALLELFEDRVPDPETLAWVKDLTANCDAWELGHDIFDRVRSRNLLAIESGDRVRECQYCFEEVCLQSLYNETYPPAAFDSCSPYWIIKNALILAREIGISIHDVVAVVAPDRQTQ
jgi:hypothetical protein